MLSFPDPKGCHARCGYCRQYNPRCDFCPDDMKAVELMQRMFAAKMNPMHSVLVMIFCNIHPRPILQGF